MNNFSLFAQGIAWKKGMWEYEISGIKVPGFIKISEYFDKLGIDVCGKSVIDINPDTGGLMFESLKRGAVAVIGMETDRMSKVILKKATGALFRDKVFGKDKIFEGKTLGVVTQFVEGIVIDADIIFGVRVFERLDGIELFKRAINMVSNDGVIVIELKYGNHCSIEDFKKIKSEWFPSENNFLKSLKQLSLDYKVIGYGKKSNYLIYHLYQYKSKR